MPENNVTALFRDNRSYIMGEVAKMSLASIKASRHLSNEQKASFALALGVGERHILFLADRIDRCVESGETNIALVHSFNLLEALKGQPVGPTVQVTETTLGLISGMVDRMKEVYAPRVARITPQTP